MFEKLCQVLIEKQYERISNELIKDKKSYDFNSYDKFLIRKIHSAGEEIVQKLDEYYRDLEFYSFGEEWWKELKITSDFIKDVNKKIDNIFNVVKRDNMEGLLADIEFFDEKAKNNDDSKQMISEGIPDNNYLQQDNEVMEDDNDRIISADRTKSDQFTTTNITNIASAIEIKQKLQNQLNT